MEPRRLLGGDVKIKWDQIGLGCVRLGWIGKVSLAKV